MNSAWWVSTRQLDEDQARVIALPIDNNFLVLGPPGSGKTNLLLLRAQYLVRAGQPNILVLVFTRTLQEFLASGGAHYDFPSDKIQTFLGWAQSLLWQLGVSTALPPDFAARRALVLQLLEQISEERGIGHLYDAILIDEGQDYLPGEINLLSRLAPTLFAVADRGQKIYRGDDPLMTLREATDETVTLRFHYRNGRAICRVADALGKANRGHVELLPTANYQEPDQPSSVDHFRCAELDSAVNLLLQKLRTQMRAYPGDLLGVLCPRRAELQALWDAFQRTDLARFAVHHNDFATASAFAPDRPILLSTLHSAKGLEFRAVHLMHTDLLARFPLQRNLAYTASTRAQTSLTFYYSGSLPSYLEGALGRLQPAPQPPSLEELFTPRGSGNGLD